MALQTLIQYMALQSPSVLEQSISLLWQWGQNNENLNGTRFKT